MSRETGSHAPDSEQNKKPKQVTQKIGAPTRRVSNTRKPGVLSNETHGAWKRKATKAEMQSINNEAEKAVGKLKNKSEASADQTKAAWLDDSITENYDEINQPDVEVMEPGTEQEIKFREISSDIKDLEAKMDAVEDPFSDEFIKLATEYNKLDQEFRKIAKASTKDELKKNPEASSLEIVDRINALAQIDTPLVSEADVRNWRVAQLDSLLRQEKALDSIMRRLSGLEAESASDEIPDKDMIQTLNSLDEDGQAIAKAWVEKIKLNKLTHTGTPGKLAEKLFAMGLISAEDKNIFKPKETSIDRQKREAKEEQEERMTNLKELGDAELSANEKRGAVDNEILDLTPEMLVKESGRSSEDILHAQYERLRDLIAEKDPRIESIRDDLSVLLSFTWDKVTNPPKTGILKGWANKFLGTPSPKEQYLQRVIDAVYMATDKKRTPYKRPDKLTNERNSLGV